ncbi:MAG TPA: MFS transporter [Noviherbaspirillum sp.]|jgi:predicted MFS family arabinose efflux permease|uniref:MFS transporter n=1 Tax=Noviherbaspirillum sp. TaxID=1926288 RepID=UPI002DDDB5F7|nr:MFS transporter [Noviherbaspirillum sp.]HEV2610818.1 MFS transporter [Noviherbaspirillum sp.]
MTPPEAAITEPLPTIPTAAVPLLSLAAFASGISLRVCDPQLPLFAREFGVSLGNASLVITFFSVAYGLSQLFFGPVGDRYGKYFIVACGSAACAVTATLCALAPSFPMLLLARLMAGATAASIIPLAMAWIGDVVPYQRRQPVLARFLIGQILGLATGVLVGGAAADRMNWRMPFFGVAVVFIVVALSLLWLNRRLPAHARISRREQAFSLKRMASEFGQVLALPWARTLLLAVFLEGAFLYGAFAFIASHMHVRFDLSLTAAGGLVMLFGLGGFLFAMLSATLVRRLGERGLALWGGLFITAALTVIGVAPAWWWGVPGCLFAGVGFYMLHNTLQTNATQMAPERRGAAVSAFACCFFLGQSAGVGAAGLLVGAMGTAAVMLSGAVGILILSVRMSRRLPARSA